MPTTVSSDGKFKSIGLSGKSRLETNDDRLLVSDESNYRLLAGVDNNGDVAIKVSKPGFNVLYASNDELIFNSSQNVFKIVNTGITSVLASGISNTAVGVWTGGGQTVVDHNLGYVPQVIAYQTNGGIGIQPLPTTSGTLIGAGGSAMGWDTLYISDITSTQIVFTIHERLIRMFANPTTMPSYTADIKYYLLQETAN